MKVEHTNIGQIPPAIEKPFRKALGHAIRNEFDDFRQTMLGLTNEQAAVCLYLCQYVAGFVAIDVCGRQWPDEDNRRGIANATTESANAREFGLTQQESYDYLVRVALGFEPLDSVFPLADGGNKDAATLSFVITGQLLLSFHPADMKWWDYLTIIEEIYEASATADLAMLPALILRSRRMGSPRDFGGLLKR